MFEGIKFIPRDQMDKSDSSDDSKKDRKKSSRWEEKRKGKKIGSSRYSSSDEELERVKRSSGKKKWYSSDEYSSSSFESESGESSSEDEKSRHSKKKRKRRNDGSSIRQSTKSKERREKRMNGSKKDRRNTEKKSSRGDDSEHDISDGSGGDNSLKEKEIVRKEMGLEWMLRPEAKREERPAEIEPEETKNEETNTVNPKELNPYLKDSGSGYPEDKDATGSDQLLSSSLVGDGGASWRMKALKRAQEQAARDGRRFEEVVEERWGSVDKLAASVSSHRAAPARAHLHAINSRKRGSGEESEIGPGSQHHKDTEKNTRRGYVGVYGKLSKMREPKLQGLLSWGRQRICRPIIKKDADRIRDEMSKLNKLSNGRTVMRMVLRAKDDNYRSPVKEDAKSETEASSVPKDTLSANQLAAKALQLRLKGKHGEAEKLMQEVENIRAKQDSGGTLVRPQKEEGSSRYVKQDISARRKNEDDGDKHLAQKIMQNKRFSVSGQADDEYDFDDDGLSRKPRKKRGGNDQASERNTTANRFFTQQEECIFCYESQKRPAHLVVAVANFTYLMLTHWEPVVTGHCCIIPMQHAPAATRSVDDYVWEEIRNFKKCLIRMFCEQGKDVVFLETAVGLAKQRRHCMIECVPLPREIFEEAPNYFKMEIEEAESEWSQHNAKKLIQTGVQGLRGMIPENIPYFHVEFGLSKGFLHPIDDEREFMSNFGLNVIRGMLKLPEEDMYRRRRHASADEQKRAVQSFARDWAPFDWTKQLHEAS